MAPSSAPPVAAVALALGLVLGACTQATGPSPAEYVAAADGVCQAASDKLAELEQEYDVAAWESAATGEGNLDVDRPERWVRGTIIPQYRSMLGGLLRLPAPDGDAAYLRDLYGDLDGRIRDLNLRPSQGRALIRDDVELQRRFESYGMEVCGTV